MKLAELKDACFKDQYLVATTGSEFKAMMTPVDLREGEVGVPTKTRQTLGLEIGDEVYLAPFHYNRGK
ncbi:hypothetical protein D3C87_2138950 [compost metagenome]